MAADVREKYESDQRAPCDHGWSLLPNWDRDSRFIIAALHLGVFLIFVA